MRKQLNSFAQVIKFCKISSSSGGLNATLAYALDNKLAATPFHKKIYVASDNTWETLYPETKTEYCFDALTFVVRNTTAFNTKA